MEEEVSRGYRVDKCGLGGAVQRFEGVKLRYGRPVFAACCVSVPPCLNMAPRWLLQEFWSSPCVSELVRSRRNTASPQTASAAWSLQASPCHKIATFRLMVWKVVKGVVHGHADATIVVV